MFDDFNLTVAVISYTVSNFAFAFMVWRKTSTAKAPSVQTLSKDINKICLYTNLAGGIGVGLAISLSVLLSSEPGYFMAPIIFAPLGYWSSFAIPIILSFIAVRWYFLEKIKKRR